MNGKVFTVSEKVNGELLRNLILTQVPYLLKILIGEEISIKRYFFLPFDQIIITLYNNSKLFKVQAHSFFISAV